MSNLPLWNRLSHLSWRGLWLLAALTICVFAGQGQPAHARADSPPVLESVKVENRWPSGLAFVVAASSASADIVEISLLLQVGNSVGDTVGRVPLAPGRTVTGEYVFVTRGSSYLPVGAEINYAVEVTDSAGNSSTSDRRRYTYLDPRFTWRSISSSRVPINAWYYGSDDRVPGTLLRAAEAAVDRMRAKAGLEIGAPFKLMLYRTREDFHAAGVFVSETWERDRPVDGLAWSRYNLVHVVIGTDIAWAVDIAAHESTHLLVAATAGQQTPAWLDEGLASYAQPNYTEEFEEALEYAINANALTPIRGLNNLPGKPDENYVGYSQAYSIVSYLLDRGGPTQMRALLTRLKEGLPMDQALTSVYSFDQDGLDARWRESVGAQSRSYESALPTPIPVPAGAMQVVVGQPTPSPKIDPPQSKPSVQPPSGWALTAGSSVVLFLLIMGVAIHNRRLRA